MIKKSHLLLFVLVALLLPAFSFAGRNEGGDITKFDVNPKTLSNSTTGGNVKLTVDLGIKLYGSEFVRYCDFGLGAQNPKYSLLFYKDVDNGEDLLLNKETLSFNAAQPYSKDFQFDVFVASQNNTIRKFYVALYCGEVGITTLNHNKVTESSRVAVTQGNPAPSGSNLIWACIADDNKYACSQGNKQDLSDVPNNACRGKQARQIDSALCGTASSGQTKDYTFKITNPLASGGANTVLDLIGVVLTWITNISIPIAVILILWAGLLMLTAGVKQTNWQKGKDILKYTVIGLAIIFIGRGFVTLIIDVLNLGQSGQTMEQGTYPPSTGGGATTGGVCNGNVCSNGAGPCRFDLDCSGDPSTIGEACMENRHCLSGLECKDRICQRPGGNQADEYCLSGRNCARGLSCDRNELYTVNNKMLGKCKDSKTLNLALGSYCEKDENCATGLKCNVICQRKDGNQIGETCHKNASPSNCKSISCSVTGSNLLGVCVQRASN